MSHVPEVLLSRYILSLSEKKAELESLMKNLRQQSPTTASYAASEMRAYVHKLVGSGAAYGFEEISDSARELLKTLDQGVVNGDELTEKFNVLIDVLTDIFAKNSA